MSSKSVATAGTAEDPTLAEINEEITHMKKRIQLSEGRRKAHFEEYTAEIRKNAETIKNLKKEMKELKAETVKPAKHDLAIVEAEARPAREVCQLLNKRPEEVVVILNHQIMDLRKKFDRMSYTLKQKKIRLQILGEEYQKLLEENSPAAVAKRTVPAKKAISQLENEINRLNLNIEESKHMQKKYKAIRDSLVEDRVHYESTLDALEADIEKQKAEIKQLQEVRREALELRDKTKGELNDLEKEVARDAAIREAQVQELRKLLEERRADLERVEKSLMPATSRLPSNLQYETEDGSEINAEENELEETFEKLKKVTGANEPEEVLEKFIAQKETRNRLTFLKNKAEIEKQQLEETNNNMIAQIEAHKFAQVKEKQENEEEIIRMKEEIEKNRKEFKELTEAYERDKEFVDKLKQNFFDICIQLKEVDNIPVPEITDGTECLDALVTNAEKKVAYLLQLTKDLDDLGLEESPDDEALDKTGILDGRDEAVGPAGGDGSGPTVETSPPVEVPTRASLKRQSQLIVEANTRKNKPYK